jgi:hypothetical protein
MNWSARRPQMTSKCPVAACHRWATAGWVVEPQLLPRQDDECAQLGSLVSRWPSGSGPGTVSGRQRHVRPLEPVRAQGWTGIPNRGDTWHSGFSRLRVCATLRVSRSGARVLGGFKPGNHAFFSLFQRVPGEPSTVEHAPGDSRLRHRPLLRANTFAFTTNRCGFKTRSNGPEEHTGLAILDGKGPASRARHRGRPARASVQTRNRTKRRTVLSSQSHPMPGPSDEQ